MRMVVGQQQLFRHGAGHWRSPRSGATRENNPLRDASIVHAMIKCEQAETGIACDGRMPTATLGANEATPIATP
jgi:hypothetical protein